MFWVNSKWPNIEKYSSHVATLKVTEYSCVSTSWCDSANRTIVCTTIIVPCLTYLRHESLLWAPFSEQTFMPKRTSRLIDDWASILCMSFSLCLHSMLPCATVDHILFIFVTSGLPIYLHRLYTNMFSSSTSSILCREGRYVESKPAFVLSGYSNKSNRCY